MELKGIVKRIEEVQQVTDSFKKQNLILSIQDGKYEQTVCVEFQQENCSKLDNISEGQDVTVGINIRGREWEHPETKIIKVFNTIVGWRIAITSEEQPTAEQMGDDSDVTEDLPF